MYKNSCTMNYQILLFLKLTIINIDTSLKNSQSVRLQRTHTHTRGRNQWVDGEMGCTVERGVASPALPSLIHSVWVSPVTPAVWVWWMPHICPPEPLKLRLGGPLCLQVMATVLHHWHIITHTRTHTNTASLQKHTLDFGWFARVLNSHVETNNV